MESGTLLEGSPEVAGEPVSMDTVLDVASSGGTAAPAESDDQAPTEVPESAASDKMDRVVQDLPSAAAEVNDVTQAASAGNVEYHAPDNALASATEVNQAAHNTTAVAASDASVGSSATQAEPMPQVPITEIAPSEPVVTSNPDASPADAMPTGAAPTPVNDRALNEEPAATSPASPRQSSNLDVEAMREMLSAAGLTLAATDPEKLRKAQDEAARFVPAPRSPRVRKMPPPPSSEPLIQVETQR